MNRLTCNLVGIFLLLAVSFSMVYAQSSSGDTAGKVLLHTYRDRGGKPIEEFSFLIKDFKLDHQTETNTLNISISYRSPACPDE